MGWISWIWGINDKSNIFCVSIYVDTLDNSKIPLWPIDEFGMEIIDPTFAVEYGDNGGGNIVVEINK